MNKKPGRYAVFLCLLCLVPYLDKAFLINDPVFLLQSQQILKEPRHPMAVNVCWVQDNQCEPSGFTEKAMRAFRASIYFTAGLRGLD